MEQLGEIKLGRHVKDAQPKLIILQRSKQRLLNKGSCSRSGHEGRVEVGRVVNHSKLFL